MTTQSGFTKIDGVPDRSELVPGMAFFAGTGPDGKTCGDCSHRGYQSMRSTWNAELQQEVFKSYRCTGCAIFKTMAGHHGPSVAADCKSCKYFQDKGSPAA